MADCHIAKFEGVGGMVKTRLKRTENRGAHRWEVDNFLKGVAPGSRGMVSDEVICESDRRYRCLHVS